MGYLCRIDNLEVRSQLLLVRWSKGHGRGKSAYDRSLPPSQFADQPIDHRFGMLFRKPFKDHIQTQTIQSWPDRRNPRVCIRIRVTQTLTSIELSLERAPQVKIPEGPDPMTKTFLPIFSILNIWQSRYYEFQSLCFESKNIFWSDVFFLKLSNLTGRYFFKNWRILL